MTSQTPTTNPWRWIALVAIVGLVAAGGWVAGVRFGQPQTTQAAAGYDIGVAAKPKPTGKVREFQRLRRRRPGRSRPV